MLNIFVVHALFCFFLGLSIFGNQSRDGDRYNNFSRHRDRERTHYNPNQQPERPSGVPMGALGKI